MGRDPALAAADAENGLVSVERAREVYGVVLREGEEPGSYASDPEASDRLRARTTPRSEESQE